MNLREWALVAFTLLMQTSVGAVLVVAALQVLLARGTAHAEGRLLDLPLLAAGIAGVLGLAASLLHLGHPLQAWLAVANVRTSWLSREVALAVLFVAAGGVFAAARAGDAGLAARLAASIVAAALGVVLLVSMWRLYMVPSQPAWDRITTPAGFLATTLLLGVVLPVVLCGPTLGVRTWRLLGLVAITLLTFQILLVPALLAGIVHEPAAAVSSLSTGGTAGWLAAGRIVAAVAAGVLLVAMLRAPAIGASTGRVAMLALALVLISETLGRILFYASAVRLGPV
jgi:anaerobic dimethyl sulfoxide reductase subunit C (anchor subunit)